MPKRTYFFPEIAKENFPGLSFTPLRDESFYREGEGLLDYVRERTAQAKYPGAMLAELYAAGEISKEQYERLRRERA